MFICSAYEHEAKHQTGLNSWIIPLLFLWCYWDYYTNILLDISQSVIEMCWVSHWSICHIQDTWVDSQFSSPGANHSILCIKYCFPPLHPVPNLSLLIDRATPMDFKRLPGEAWSIAWVWCSSRAMASSPLPMPSGTCSWPQQLLFITMPFGSTFTEVLQT